LTTTRTWIGIRYSGNKKKQKVREALENFLRISVIAFLQRNSAGRNEMARRRKRGGRHVCLTVSLMVIIWSDGDQPTAASTLSLLVSLVFSPSLLLSMLPDSM
jgi:hypothetical protein